MSKKHKAKLKNRKQDYTDSFDIAHKLILQPLFKNFTFEYFILKQYLKGNLNDSHLAEPSSIYAYSKRNLNFEVNIDLNSISHIERNYCMAPIDKFHTYRDPSSLSKHEYEDMNRHFIKKLIRDDRLLSKKIYEEYRANERFRKLQQSAFQPVDHNSTHIHILSSKFTLFSSEACGLHVNNPLEHEIKELNHTISSCTPEMRSQRLSLPISKHYTEIVKLMSNSASQFILLVGSTGSGKSTQLPQYLVDGIIFDRPETSSPNTQKQPRLCLCTQPRRVAAISLAERVAEERGEPCDGQGTVGYQIRLHAKTSPNNRILYCTTGVLLRKLQDPDFLSRASYVLVDEVHERQVETDMLLCMLKLKAPQYPKLKIVLMSATVDVSRFQQYLHPCPLIRVDGVGYPVETHHLPEVLSFVGRAQKALAIFRDHRDGTSDHAGASAAVVSGNGRSAKKQSSQVAKLDADAVAELVVRILQVYRSSQAPNDSASSVEGAEEGDRGQSVLVFLSGQQQIENVGRVLRCRGVDTLLQTPILYLYGSMSPESQRRAFQCAPSGRWRVILATDIAETSITIPDVTHVVDSGLHKQMKYHPESDMHTLTEVPISLSSARQRRGRAGRVSPGHCWRLYEDPEANSESRLELLQAHETVDIVASEGLSSDAETRTPPPASSESDLDHASDCDSNSSCGDSVPETGFDQESEQYGGMAEWDEPEMQRTALEELVLQAMLVAPPSLSEHPWRFLAKCMDAPEPYKIFLAVQRLISLGAVCEIGERDSAVTEGEGEDLGSELVEGEDLGSELVEGAGLDSKSSPSPSNSGEGEDLGSGVVEGEGAGRGNQRGVRLTALGRQLAMLPLDVRLGKMLVTAVVLNRIPLLSPEDTSWVPNTVLDTALTVAAVLSYRSPFGFRVASPGKGQNRGREELAFLSPISFKAEFRRDAPGDKGVSDLEEREELVSIRSDHLACARALNIWESYLVPTVSSGDGVGSIQEQEQAFALCLRYNMSWTVMCELRALRRQLLGQLMESGLVGASEVEDIAALRTRGVERLNEQTAALFQCCLVAGFSDRVLAVYREAVDEDASAVGGRRGRSGRGNGRNRRRKRAVRTVVRKSDGGRVKVHPVSLLHRTLESLMDDRQQDRPLILIFSKQVTTSQTYIYDCGTVPLLALLLFSPPLRSSQDRKLLLCGPQSWLKFRMEEADAVALKRLQDVVRQLAERAVSMAVPPGDDPENAGDMAFLGTLLTSVRPFLMGSARE